MYVMVSYTTNRIRSNVFSSMLRGRIDNYCLLVIFLTLGPDVRKTVWTNLLAYRTVRPRLRPEVSWYYASLKLAPPIKLINSRVDIRDGCSDGDHQDEKARLNNRVSR